MMPRAKRSPKRNVRKMILSELRLRLGFRPGLVRETKPEYMRILEEQKKSEASKAQTNEKKDAEKNSVKEVVKKEEVQTNC